MNNFEKMKLKISNMSVKEFAMNRIRSEEVCNGFFIYYFGDWNNGDKYYTGYGDAINKEIDWLLEESE